MSETDPPDAAVGGDAGSVAALPVRPARGVAARAASAKPADGIAARMARRWWIVAVTVAVALLGALAYLLLTTPIYTATCVLSPDRRVGGVNDVAPDEFLAAQRELIFSKPVLSATIAALDPATRLDAGGATEQTLHDALQANVSTGEQVIYLRLDSTDPQAAAMALNALTAEYLKVAGDQQHTTAGSMAELTRARDQRAVERAAAEKAVNDYRASANVTGTDADKSAASARLDQLNAALVAAQSELSAADAAIKTAQDAVADPGKLQALIEANRPRGIFAGLDQERSRVQGDLQAAQALLARQRQSMLPQHPMVRQTQRTIDQLNARLVELNGRYGTTYRDDLVHQREAAQRKVADLKPLIEQESKSAQEYTTKAARLAELDAALKRADAALAEVDGKLRNLAVSAGSSAQGPPTMRIVQPAQAPHHPSHPDRVRTLAVALLAGLIGGCVVAGIGKSKR